MGIWLNEKQTEHLSLSCQIRETLFSGQSVYQNVVVADSYEFGRMLMLDGVFQTSIFEEYIYHEMITHVPLFSHPSPKKILVVGGGDGGAAREAVRHDAVESVELVEIDGMVVEVSKQYLPEISSAMLAEHPKLRIDIGDGIARVQAAKECYDIIIVDCSDPIGPGVGLFAREFYQNVNKALKPDGMFVQQTESPFYHQSLIRRIYQDIADFFPITRIYLASIPLYPGGLHSFTIGSKAYDPLEAKLPDFLPFETRYYNQAIHRSCFALPNFLYSLLPVNK